MNLIRDKSFLLFVLVCSLLVVSSKLLYISDITFPNLSLVIPVLVIMTAFPTFKSAYSNYLKLSVIGAVILVDIAFWGLQSIYLFTWSSFLLVWVLAKRMDLSFKDSFRKVTLDSLKGTAALILLYDAVTCFGMWILFGGSITGVYTAQIPFTMYHLSSLIFVPGLVLVGKVITKIKVKDRQVARLSVEDLAPINIPFTAKK